MDKIQEVTLLIDKLKSIARTSIRKGNMNRGMAAISFAAETMYNFNQCYSDDELEGLIINIANIIKQKKHFGEYHRTDKSNIILVYDGFGLDTRGVILMYLNALGLNEYDICYVTNYEVRSSIPAITKMCNKYHIDMKFIRMKNYYEWCIELSEIFENKKPRAAFFYTTPFDVSGCASFHMYENLCDRFLIDLTDHAFWLGKCSSDYFLGSREMSAYIQHYQRHIQKAKCIKLGVNLLIENSGNHEGLPFDIKKEKFIFSGGSLYKTLGDEKKLYYKLINHILKNHRDIKYIYAGNGDDRELKKVIEKYPNRAYFISERKDFYYLIENCVLYINTYPMFGGMMMKYAAFAHRIPVTLKHGSDSDGLLLNQSECQIEYDDFDSMIEDIDKLLDDDEYRHARERLLDGAVITEERFANNIRSTIEFHHTDYEHTFEVLDTKKFRKEYYDRFEMRKNMNNVANRRNISLLPFFPGKFFFALIRKIKR